MTSISLLLFFFKHFLDNAIQGNSCQIRLNGSKLVCKTNSNHDTLLTSEAERSSFISFGVWP